MPAATRLRKATVADAARLAAFGARTFAAAYTGLMSDDAIAEYIATAYHPDIQRNEIERADSIILIADRDEYMLGFAWICRPDTAPACVPSPDAANLARIYVDPDIQSTGVGALLIRGAETEARGLGAPLIWLAVWERNPRAIAFYRRNGYTEIGRTGFPADPDPECDVVMAKGTESC